MKRNYDKELKDTIDHKYTYDFDLYMHTFMLKTFAPFFQQGNVLELGSSGGEFTIDLENYDCFDDITCIEASKAAIDEAKKKVASDTKIIHSTFEEVKLRGEYRNIFLIHTLEHVNDRVGLLKKINDKWLSSIGYLFLVCPNANAASRQIATYMGKLKHPCDILPSEKTQGHRVTYTFDTLERDIKESGLKIIHRSGICFKSLANFQLDEALIKGIISNSYLEGCYQLGQKYPELCASIFFLCEKG